MTPHLSNKYKCTTVFSSKVRFKNLHTEVVILNMLMHMASFTN